MVNHCSIISQVIIYLKELKRLILILNLALFCSRVPVALLVVDLSLLLRTSTRSAHCRLVSISIFHALCCTTPQVVMLIVDLPVSIFVALVCSTPQVALLVVDLSQLSQPFLLCVEHFNSLCLLFSCLWWLSKYWLSTFEILSISTFFSLLSIWFLSSCFLCFCFSVFTSTQRSHAIAKKACMDIYVYIYIYI